MKIRTLALCLLFVTAVSMLTAADTGNVQVDNAWKALSENRQQDALQLFEAAIRENPDHLRAYLGLMYLHNMHHNYSGAWAAFGNVLRIEKNYYPYAYAQWVSPMVFSTDNRSANTYEKLYGRVMSDDGAPGILKAMAAEQLGVQIARAGDLDDAKEMYNTIGFIRSWSLAGPFENTSASGYDKVYGPEKEYKTSAVYEGISGIPVSWFPMTAMRHDGWIDFTLYFYYSHAVYYANTFVYSPEKQTVDFRIGTSGFFKAYINDETVLETEEEFNNDLDTYVARTTLQKGWNRVLIKCGYSEINRCNFLARFTDENGRPVSGLEFSTEAKQYPVRPGAAVTSRPNFAEEFFKTAIKNHPDHLENYLLLADCYLRNDKGVEAEKVLKQALQQAPDAVILLDHMLEAYIRGRKYDEITTTLEKLASMNADIPSALEYQISENMSNEEYDKVEELLGRLERFIPGTESMYTYRFALFAAKSQYDKVMELNEEAFKKFPNNYRFMSMAAVVADKVHGDPKKSISIMRDYLERSYTEDAILALAEGYMQQSQFDKWEETYLKLFEIEPASPGYHYTMANQYFGRQDYDKAEASLNKALAICPANPLYYKKLGEIHRIRDKKAQAEEAFRSTLTYNPTDYDTRAMLRELQGKKSVFENFSSINVDSLIKAAPSAQDFPDDPAILLLDDVKRVVYDGGSSETLQEMLIKVFNKQGIDDFKEYSLGYNSYAEALNIEKAVVRKKDGTEVKADINGGYIVFKSLEEEDCIYIRWRKKNYYGGKLHNHFWDTYYFNYYYPIALVRYSLLVPKGYTFNYKTRNMPQEPAKSETEDGLLYLWSLQDEPAIDYESGMPSLDEIGKVLTISSIQDWAFIVDWYRDIAQTKTRTTYEIEEKMQEILANKDKMSEEDILREVYEFITEYIRYSSVSFRQSGWVPQKARDVLVTKIGDCKDVATLCISMLREAGISANYMLVKTAHSSRAPADLPMPDFDHCIVSVDTKKGPQILDLTANNFPIGSVPEMDLDGFALLIKPGVSKPTTLDRNHFAARSIRTNTVMTVNDDGSVLIDQKTVFSGSLSAYLRDYFRHKGKNEQEKSIIESLGARYPNVKLKGFSFENLDTITNTLGYNLTFEVPGFVMETGRFRILKTPWSYAESGDEALAYEKRTYPYAYYPSTDTVTEKMEIRLPAGYEPVELQDASYTSPVAQFAAKYTFKNGVINGTRTFVNKKNTVQTDEYEVFKTFYNNVVKEDGKQILLEQGKPASGGKKKK